MIKIHKDVDNKEQLCIQNTKMTSTMLIVVFVLYELTGIGVSFAKRKTRGIGVGYPMCKSDCSKLEQKSVLDPCFFKLLDEQIQYKISEMTQMLNENDQNQANGAMISKIFSNFLLQYESTLKM